MGIFRTRTGRIRKLAFLPLVVLVPLLGFVVAMYVQPERFARDDACASAGEREIANTCDKAVMVEACVVADDGIRECVIREIPAHGRIERPKAVAGGEIELAVCHAPYVPARVSSPLNSSQSIDGCRRPE